ncbi:MAG: carboxypeptidase regulatory-like domain-containing protein [Candidatus Kerfeldbacteria bacterium]|nr:carboxypeptidase regulatory-like domain-containing protein [Candidatus Kerfeldbacteria bacterium]
MGTVIVTGTVTDPDGNAVPYAGVDFYNENWTVHSWASTDQNGVYAIVGTVANGTYYISAYPPQDSAFTQSDRVTVNYSGSTVTANYQFASATKTLVVNVSYDDGTPVTTAQVNAWNNRGGGTSSNVDENGQATFTLSGGEWQVMPEAPWNQEDGRREDVDWVSSEQKFVTFANDDTEETQTVAITVQKSNARITGRLVDPDGGPVQNAWVDFRQGDGRGIGTSTDSDGDFSAALVAGNYKMGIWAGQQYSNLYFQEMNVSVAVNQTLDLGTLSMSEYDAQITGTLTDTNGDPVSGLQVNTWLETGSGWSNTQTGDDGIYSLGVYAGQWQVSPDNRPESGYVYAGDSQRVKVTSGQTVTGVDFEVSVADATLVLQLVAEDGGSVQDIFGGVGCYEAGGGFKDFGGGVHGGFDRGVARLPVVGGKTYTCNLWLPPEVEYSVEGEVEVEVPEGETVTEQVTLLAHNATIRGFLKDQNGQLVRNTEAEIWAADENFMSWRNTRLNADGSFSMTVRDGTYNLGYWFPMRVGEESEYLQTHSENNRVTVAEGATVTKVLLAPKRNASVTGEILDPDGDPVEGHLWIGASNRRFLEERVKGDFEGAMILDIGSEVMDGEFSLGLVAGTHAVTGDKVEYEVFVGLPPEKQSMRWMPPQNVTLTPDAGDELELTMQFTEADTEMTGTVRTEEGEIPDHGFVWAWNDLGGFSGVEVWNGEFALPLNISEGFWHIGAHAEIFGEGFFEAEETMVLVSSDEPLEHDFVVSEYRYDVPESSSFSFDAGTAFSATLEDGTEITVPAGAMGESGSTVNLTATPDVNFYETGDKQVGGGFVWDFEAFVDNQLVESFNSNVTLSIPYNEDELSELDGMDEENISGQYYDDQSNTWNPPDTTTVDTVNDRIILQLSHFTQVGIVGVAGGGSLAASSGSAGEKDLVVSGYDNSGGPRVAKYTKDGDLTATWEAYNGALRMGVETLVGDGDGDGDDEVWTIPGAGYPKQVRRFDGSGTVMSQFATYPNGVRGRVNAQLTDWDGDGNDELVMVPKDAGMPAHVTVWDENGNLLKQFSAYPGYEGGVLMKAADLDGDGTGELVLATHTGHNHITVWNTDGDLVMNWSAYGTNATGGISSLAVSDMDGNGEMEVVVGANERTSMVRRFDKDGNLLSQFDTLGDPIADQGVRVWTLDSNDDGEGEVLSLRGSGAGFRKHSKDGTLEAYIDAWPSDVAAGRMVFGVVTDVDGDGDDDLVSTLGPGAGPMVRILDTRTGTVLTQWDALNEGYRGGIMVTPIAK